MLAAYLSIVLARQTSAFRMAQDRPGHVIDAVGQARLRRGIAYLAQGIADITSASVHGSLAARTRRDHAVRISTLQTELRSEGADGFGPARMAAHTASIRSLETMCTVFGFPAAGSAGASHSVRRSRSSWRLTVIAPQAQQCTASGWGRCTLTGALTVRTPQPRLRARRWPAG